MVFKWLQGKKASPSLKDTNRAKEPRVPGTVDHDPATASGLEMTDAYYPGHDPIDFYGSGGFRFGSMSHQGAILFLPSGTRRWDAETPTSLSTDHLAKILAEKSEIEILIIGTGKTLTPLSPDIKDAIRSAGIKMEVMDTGAAVRTLNILLSEDRAVAAALFPVP